MSDASRPAGRRTGGEFLDVLLVEDALDQALMIRALLQDSMGCSVTLAQDGIRGCQLAEHQRWDLVITDLNLPGRPGEDVVRTSLQAAPETPVIVLTGHEDRVEGAQAAGATEVLQKPLDAEKLLALVNQVRRQLGAAGRESGEETDSAGRRILALSGLPGDAEAGCGGILLGHRALGHRVVVVAFSAGGEEEDVPDRRRETERAAERLGGELILAEGFASRIPTQDEMNACVAEAVDRIGPDTVYAPSGSDVRPSRARVHRAAVVAGGDVQSHFGYQAATTTLAFRPSYFVDVTERWEEKLGILGEYRSGPRFRPHLQTDVIAATAYYWGRFLGYSLAEPLEVVRRTD